MVTKKRLTCCQRGTWIRGNLHPGVNFFDCSRYVISISLAGNLMSWQSTGGKKDSTPTTNTFLSCTVCQRACPSLLSQLYSHQVTDFTHCVAQEIKEHIVCKSGKQRKTCTCALCTMDDASYFLVIRLGPKTSKSTPPRVTRLCQIREASLVALRKFSQNLRFTCVDRSTRPIQHTHIQ